MLELTKLKNLTQLNLKSIRDGFGEGLLQLGDLNPDVVAMSADLAESLRMHKFAEKFPDRYLEMGVAEQNMAGVAAGLALSGKIPFMGSFANFSPARNFDQIRISICMMNLSVKIISSHAGFSYGEDGMSVQMLEDIAMMRVLPNMTVVVPADANQAAMAAIKSVEVPGPVYIRLGRAETPQLFEGVDFEIGKPQLLRQGKDLTIVATGYMVFRALLAADMLAKEGIDAQVLNIHTIKPFNQDLFLELVSQTRAVVTAEEAQRAGGLGGMIAEMLAQRLPIPMEIVGVNDLFGASGTSLELSSSRGVMEKDIYHAALRVYPRKSM